LFAIKAGIITKDNIAEILMTAQREATTLEAKLPEQPTTTEEKVEEKTEQQPEEKTEDNKPAEQEAQTLK